MTPISVSFVTSFVSWASPCEIHSSPPPIPTPVLPLTMRHTCTFCEKVFVYKSLCEVHELSHLPWHFGKYLCRACSQRFDGQRRLHTRVSSRRHHKRIQHLSPAILPDVEKLRRRHLLNVDDSSTRGYIQLLLGGSPVTAAEISSCSAVSDSPRKLLPITDHDSVALDPLHPPDLAILDTLDFADLFSIEEGQPATPTQDELPERHPGHGPTNASPTPCEPISPAPGGQASRIDQCVQNQDGDSTCAVNPPTAATQSIVSQAWGEAEQARKPLPLPPDRAPYKRMRPNDHQVSSSANGSPPSADINQDPQALMQNICGNSPR